MSFRDERGEAVTLGQYFGAKPVILTLNDFNCPNLCPLVLDNLAHTLPGLSLELGVQYEVLTISIDPRDTPPLAAQLQHQYLGRANLAKSDPGWHFLTGDPRRSRR